MQKPALGRKLEAPGNVAGVRSLIRGNRAKAAVPEAGAKAPAKASIPRWYLFGGDLLLVALALLTAYKSPGPLSWKQMVFCVVVVAIGAGLGVFAIGATEPSQNDARMKRGPFAGGRRE